MPRPGNALRPAAWVAPALAALALVVLLLVASAAVALYAVAASGAVAEGESQWTRNQKDVVVLYHAWAAGGDAEARVRLEGPVAYHRQVARVLELAANPATDRQTLSQAAGEFEGFAQSAPHFARAFSWSWRFPPARRMVAGVVAEWGEAQGAVGELLDLLPSLDQAVAGGDQEAVDALLSEATRLDHEIALYRDQYLVAADAWTRQAFRVPLLAILVLGLLLLLAGAVGIRFTLRRLDRSQRELYQSRERFRQVTEGIDQVFWLSTPDKGEMLYVSPAYEAIWGEPVEAASATRLGWADRIVDEDHARVLEMVERQRLEALEYEFRIVDGAGQLRWIRERSFPVRDPEGKVVRVAGFSEDVTERKALEVELLQAQRLRSVARLAAGVGHEFNNVLTAIRSHASFLAEDLADRPGAMEDLEGIRAATVRAESLTRKLLAFGRQQVIRPAPLDPSRFMEELDRLLPSLLPRGIQTALRMEGELPCILADESHLREALVALVGNSRRALEASGSRIILVARHLAPEDLEHPDGGGEAVIPTAAGPLDGVDYLVLEVRDDGPGIPEALQARIFEPFHWAREGAPSQGLGLPSVLGILEQMGGGVRLDSVLGEGTRVRLFLPLAPGARAEGEDPDAGGTG